MYHDKTASSSGLVRCEFCGQPIPFLDFQEGWAAVISGKPTCAACAEEGVWIDQDRAVSPGVLKRRATPRYLPSIQCDLTLRHKTWLGWLAGNLSLKWLDISEGGLRAVIRTECRVDDRLRARIGYRPKHRSYALDVRVRGVQPSTQLPGGFVVGVQFQDPSPELKEMIRDVHASTGILGRVKPENESPSRKRA